MINIYSLKTEFLYYVKEKVTENPAIYFVVDIATKNVFWIYLSDELLMELDFEGHKTKRYAFNDNDILKDIISFEKTLHNIANERNKKFINRTEEQIAEIQEAVEYINDLFSNDLHFIKDTIFPDLWRFGIANSCTNDLKISIFNPVDGTTCEMPSPNANIFAIYPQIKGKPDYGFKEIDATSKYFNHIDATGTTSPMKYVQNVAQTMVEDYFNNHLCLNIMPNIALEEITCSFVDKVEKVLGLEIGNNKNIKNISDIVSSFAVCMRYIVYIVKNHDTLSEPEINVSNALISNINSRRIYNDKTDILDYIQMFSCNEQFIQFYQKEKNEQKFNANVFGFVSINYNVYYLAMKELEKRNVKTINRIWEYDNKDLNCPNEEKLLAFYYNICERWFPILQDEYKNLYEQLFITHKYMNAGNFKYKLSGGTSYRTVRWGINKYNTNNSVFSIEKSSLNDNIFFALEKNKNIQYYMSFGHDLNTFLNHKMLIYDSLRCLLCQGICKGLNLKSKGILIQGMRNFIFN